MNKKLLPFHLLFFFFAFQSAFISISAQQKDVFVRDTTGLVSFSILAPKIEQNNHIKLYYKPEWFENKRFRESIADLPLEDCLTIVKRLTELNCVALNPVSYVFTPVELRNYTNKKDRKGKLIIGDENNVENTTKATLSGKISDAKNGKPLFGARIDIDQVNVTASTDREGNYKFTIPVGEYNIRLNYGGFEENNNTIVVSGNGIVDFEMSQKSILLKEIIVVDKAANLNLIRTQMSSIRLSAKNIKELPMFLGEKDIIKSATLLPGVQSTGEFGTGFFVRGGSADQNLILVEDVPLFNSSHMFGLTSAINPDGVNSVNFLKAGIPAKYGERASSVMDIRLASNPDSLSFKGGIGLLDSRLNLEVPLFNKKVALLVGGRTSYSDWLLHALPDAELKNSSADFFDVNALITVRFNPKNSLILFGYFSDDKFAFTPSSPYHYDNLLASVRYSHVFSEKLYSSLLVGMSRYRNDLIDMDPLKPDYAYKINSSINYNNAKLNFTWLPKDQHTVDFGLNAIQYLLQPGKLTPVTTTSVVIPLSTDPEKALEVSAFISDNITFTPQISGEFGLRFTNYADLGPGTTYIFNSNAPRTAENIMDTVSYGNNQIIKWYTSLEPRLSMRYSVDNLSSVKFSYNRISQFINLITNTSVMSPTDVYKMSSPNVKPLVSNQFALGYFRNFSQNAVEASVEVYYKKLDNVLEYRDGASIIVNKSLETDLLNASGYNYGIEFYVKKNTGRLTGWASYTYSRSMRRTTSTFAMDQINGNNYYPSPFDKPHNFLIMANYHLTRRWWVSGTFNYNTGKPVTLPELKYNYDGKQYVYFSDRNKYRLPDFRRLDIAITHDETLRLKQKWRGSWTFSILNVLGQKNPYSVFYKSVSGLESNYLQSFNMYQMFIIEKPIPTLTYNFTF